MCWDKKGDYNYQYFGNGRWVSTQWKPTSGHTSLSDILGTQSPHLALTRPATEPDTQQSVKINGVVCKKNFVLT